MKKVILAVFVGILALSVGCSHPAATEKKVVPEKQCPFTEEAEGIKFTCNVVFTADNSKIYPAVLENPTAHAIRVKEVTFTEAGIEVTTAIYRLEAKSAKKVSRDGHAFYLSTLGGITFGFFK
jgi:uncharacterized protein YcfL